MTQMDYEAWLRDPASELPAPCLPEGRRNYLTPDRETDPARLYCGAGGLAATLAQMEPVAAQLVRESRLAEALPGSMPAGYTFLAQLLAHELSAKTQGGDLSNDPPEPEPVSVRRNGLMLDSIFGPLDHHRPVPGLFRFRRSVADPGRPIAVDLRWQADRADIFDARNGDTPMLAQMSALFILLHHRTQAALDGRMGEGQARRLARCVAAAAFQRILRHDLLPRLLLPVVSTHVMAQGWTPADSEALRPDARFPVEVSNAAFRFGHALVRSTYLLNDRSPALPIGDLTRGFNGLERVRASNSNFWRVDWRLFFGQGPGVQMSRRLRASLPPDLEKAPARLATGHATPGNGRGRDELALKDLARCVGGGVQKVAALADRLAPRLRTVAGMTGWALWDAEERAALLRDWLDAQPGEEPAHLLADPPLYLYLLIEAGAEHTQKGFGDGRTLGALGSILVAEAVVPRLRQGEALVAAEPSMALAETAVFGAVPPPATMPELVEFLTSTD